VQTCDTPLNIRYAPHVCTSLDQIQKDINFIGNIAIASSKISTLTIEENKGTFQIRPTIHPMLRAPSGEGKSTIMNEISKALNVPVQTEITRAGLVGTIDPKTQQYIAGAAWEARNSVLLLDEFTFGRKKEGWEVFLQLLESQTYGKRFGIYSTDQNEQSGDLYYKVGKGRIDLKTRFAAVIATMKRFEIQRGEFFLAFITRVLPYPYTLPISDLARMLQGEAIFVYKPIQVEPNIVVPLDTYRKIVDHCTEVFKNYPNLQTITTSHIANETCQNLFARTIGDICRVWAVNRNLDRMDDIINWKLQSTMLVGKAYRDAAERKRKLTEEQKAKK
jgi:hypothetical protein